MSEEKRAWLFRNRFVLGFACLLLIGLAVVLSAYLQSSRVATVTEVGTIDYSPGAKSARTRRSTRYRTTATVRYTDADETERIAEVAWSATNKNALPRVGEQVQIAVGLTGMVPYPNRVRIAVGGTAAMIAGFFLFCIVLGRIAKRRNKIRNSQGDI